MSMTKLTVPADANHTLQIFISQVAFPLQLSSTLCCSVKNKLRNYSDMSPVSWSWDCLWNQECKHLPIPPFIHKHPVFQKLIFFFLSLLFLKHLVPVDVSTSFCTATLLHTWWLSASAHLRYERWKAGTPLHKHTDHRKSWGLKIWLIKFPIW